MLEAAKELWPYETRWPDWSPQVLFDLWKLHRDAQAGISRAPARADTDAYCRQLMLLVALNLSRKRRMESLDRCGKGASDAAQEYVMHLYSRSSKFVFPVEHPLVLIKAFNTAIARLIADTLDATRDQAVNASTLCEEEDALAWIPGAAPTQPSDELLNRMRKPEQIEAILDDVERIMGTAAREAGERDCRSALLRAARHQAHHLAKHNNLPAHDALPPEIYQSISAEALMLLNTRLGRMMQDLVLSN